MWRGKGLSDTTTVCILPCLQKRGRQLLAWPYRSWHISHLICLWVTQRKPIRGCVAVFCRALGVTWLLLLLLLLVVVYVCDAGAVTAVAVICSHTCSRAVRRNDLIQCMPAATKRLLLTVIEGTCGRRSVGNCGTPWYLPRSGHKADKCRS